MSSPPACWQADALFKDLPALKHLNLSCVGCLLALGVSLLPVLLRSPRAAAKLRPLHKINAWLKVPNSKSSSALGCQAWGKALPEKTKMSPSPSPSTLFLFLLRRVNYLTLAELESMRTPASWWGRVQFLRHNSPRRGPRCFISRCSLCAVSSAPLHPPAPSTHV